MTPSLCLHFRDLINLVNILPFILWICTLKAQMITISRKLRKLIIVFQSSSDVDRLICRLHISRMRDEYLWEISYYWLPIVICKTVSIDIFCMPSWNWNDVLKVKFWEASSFCNLLVCFLRKFICKILILLIKLFKFFL